MTPRRRAAAPFVAAALGVVLAPAAAVAHPGHAAHAAGPSVGWVAPLAVCAGVVVGVAAVHLRAAGALSDRAAAVGCALSAFCLSAGVGLFAGVV